MLHFDEYVYNSYLKKIKATNNNYQQASITLDHV